MKTILLTSILYISVLSAYGQEFNAGVVYDTVTCIAIPEQSYSLYLPNDYDKDIRKWPVLYIFEPAARGGFATKIFQPLAEEFGYIIIASNNSRNGSWDLVFDAADAMFQDSFDRFRIDTSRIYLSGFSGGSRAAVTVASLTDKVAGVIGCGAAFSLSKNHQPKSTNSFIYYGLIGSRDMNYLEMQELKINLDKLGIKNRVHVFDGPHRWPPLKDLRFAFEWIEITNENKKFDETVGSMWLNRADSLFKAGDYLLFETDAQDIQRLSQNNLLLQEKLASLRTSKDYKVDFKVQKKLVKKEEDLRAIYIQALTEMAYSKLASTDSTIKDMTWWQNEVKKLKKYEKSKDLYKSRMASRVLNMIWASCAEGLWNYVNKGDLQTAVNLTELWVYIMPEQLWSNWNAVRIYALNNDKKKTLKYLEKSIALGIKPTPAMVNNPNFDFINSTETYNSFARLVNK